jgi:hypothetical protein
VPWQSGHYYLFSKLLINAVVPSESGLFALYACREQVFIAESADLRKALLLLHADMLRFGLTCPTGFTFELCPSALRVKRLKELLAEHDLVASDQPSNILLYG